MTRRFLDTKKQWVASHIWMIDTKKGNKDEDKEDDDKISSLPPCAESEEEKEKRKKTLLECIWRDLVPFDIIDCIDFQSLVDLKSKLMQKFDEESEDIKILKTLVVDDKRYDLLISVLEPELDEDKKSYIFFITFTDSVNNIPFDTRQVKVVFYAKKFSFTTAMLYEEKGSGRNKGIFSEMIIGYFDDLNIEELSKYHSEQLRNILFNYLCFIKIRQINDTDKSYNVIELNNAYYIYRDSQNDCLVCSLYQNDAEQIIKRLVRKKGIISLNKRKTLHLVYLEQSPQAYVSNNPQIKILSVEEYLYELKANIDGEMLSKIRQQIAFLHSFVGTNNNDSSICDFSHNYDNNYWIKFAFSYTEDNISDIQPITDKRQTKYIYNKLMHRKIKNDDIFEKKWKNYDLLSCEPSDEKNYSSCTFYKKKKAKNICNNMAIRHTIIIPENESTFCFITDAMLNDAKKMIYEMEIEVVYGKHKWFKLLCAVNLLYTFQKYQHAVEDLPFYIDKMIKILSYALSKNNKHLYNLGYTNGCLNISIKVEYREYVFTFPIDKIKLETLKIKDSKSQENVYDYMPIAPILYKYSNYLLACDNSQ